MKYSSSLSLALLLSVPLAAIENSTIRPIAAIGALGIVGGAGTYAAKKNKEYAQQEKRADWQLTGPKLVTAAICMTAADLWMNGLDQNRIKDNLVKLGILGTSYTLICNDTVANMLQKSEIGKMCSPITGLLTDPIDKHGREDKHISCFARGLMGYFGLRYLAIQTGILVP